MKFLAQIVLGIVLTVLGVVLITAYANDDVLFWQGRPLGILIGVLGLVYAVGAVWTRQRE